MIAEPAREIDSLSGTDPSREAIRAYFQDVLERRGPDFPRLVPSGVVVGLLDEIERLEKGAAALVEALQEIQAEQPEMVDTFKRHGIVFAGPLGNDPDNWEHVAFSVYVQLCETESLAREALAAWESK